MAVEYSDTLVPISDLTSYANDLTKLLGLNDNNEAAFLDVKVLFDIWNGDSSKYINSNALSSEVELGDSDEKIPTQKAVKTYILNHQLSGPQGPPGVDGDQGPQGAPGAGGSVTWADLQALFGANGFTLTYGSLRANRIIVDQDIDALAITSERFTRDTHVTP